MDQLTLIIISYNSYSIIKECQHDLLKANAYRTIIIDNCSPDNSADRLKHEYPNVEVVKLPHNIGYGRAANVGLELTKTPYAFLLNPDLYTTAASVDRLLEVALANKGSAAIFAPAVKESAYIKSGLIERDWISGSAMLFDMEEMKDIGLFDEHIFLFSEESDLCRRTRNAGKKILRCSDLYFKHLKGHACAPSPHIEKLKGWHFGWSRAYYRTKHRLSSGKKSEQRIAQRYWVKSLFALNPHQRLKYKARADGTKAFLSGQAAFDKNGYPAGTLNMKNNRK